LQAISSPNALHVKHFFVASCGTQGVLLFIHQIFNSHCKDNYLYTFELTFFRAGAIITKTVHHKWQKRAGGAY
jgi:hypothetical protein